MFPITELNEQLPFVEWTSGEFGSVMVALVMRSVDLSSYSTYAALASSSLFFFLHSLAQCPRLTQ
jgi:hypothetical protein